MKKKFEKMSQPIFEVLPQEAMSLVLGGDDWCQESTGGGTHPTFGSYSSDTVFKDGNGVVMYKNYCCASTVN